MFLQYRVKYLSIPHKAQIGKMNAVYCSLPVVADDVTGSKEIDVFLSTLLQRTEKGIQCLILVLYLLGNPGVKRRVGKERVFHEKDRRIGMLAADSGILINITNYITDNKNIIFDIRNISNKLITDLIFI